MLAFCCHNRVNYVNPIRSQSVSPAQHLMYNTNTNEIVKGSVTMTPASKSFIIDHPDNPKNQDLVHACLEGPEVGVFYRGKCEIVDNQSVTIELPKYAIHLAFNYTVQLTPIGVCKKQLLLECSEVENNSFTVYGNNCHFFWLVHGNRDNNMEVEPYKSDIRVHGDGPYTWSSNPLL